MKIKSTLTLIAATSIGLLAGSMVCVAALDEESGPGSVPYATGTAGDPQAA